MEWYDEYVHAILSSRQRREERSRSSTELFVVRAYKNSLSVVTTISLTQPESSTHNIQAEICNIAAPPTVGNAIAMLTTTDVLHSS